MVDGIAPAIKESVSMEDVIDLYLPGVKKRMGRIPCPIHNGKDSNFAFKGEYFKCYVCGESGDIISFVMKYFALDFVGALKKLVDDFRLPFDVDGTSDKEEQEKRLRELEIARKKAQAKQEAEERAYDNYHMALDKYVFFLHNMERFAPAWPDDEIDYRYVEACKNIDAAEYELEIAETELMRTRG